MRSLQRALRLDAKEHAADPESDRVPPGEWIRFLQDDAE
jgi:hypothetical protein